MRRILATSSPRCRKARRGWASAGAASARASAAHLAALAHRRAHRPPPVGARARAARPCPGATGSGFTGSVSLREHALGLGDLGGGHLLEIEAAQLFLRATWSRLASTSIGVSSSSSASGISGRSGSASVQQRLGGALFGGIGASAPPARRASPAASSPSCARDSADRASRAGRPGGRPSGARAAMTKQACSVQ